jgi:hypothetical protein
MNPKGYTPKQMGDAGEALVVFELTLAGAPAAKMPDNWPSYDVIADPEGAEHPQRISVKTRTFKRGGSANVDYCKVRKNNFDWLAIVLLACPVSCPGEKERRIFIIPKAEADKRFQSGKEETNNRGWMYLQVDKMAEKLPEFENNFRLSESGIAKSR